MAGAGNNYSSNISLALTAAPQGVYDPAQQLDQSGHFNSTQTLSSILSDVSTLKILFLIAIPAGSIITLQLGGSELIGLLCPANGEPVGFVDEFIPPGGYGVVKLRGICRQYSGLTPATTYYTAAGGGVATVATGARRLGVSLDSTSIAFIYL